jgi:hypothetical protein
MRENHDRLGEALAAALGEGPSLAAVAAQRMRLLASLGAKPRSLGRWSPRMRTMALAAAAAAMLLVAFALRRYPRTDLHVTWGGRAIHGPAEFEAVAPRPQSLDFSEGSQLLLEPGTRAKLLHLSSIDTTLALDDGHILASIRQHTGITWTITAGPYRVQVVGTRFTLDWDRERRALRVAVREGRVRVSGGDLPIDGVVRDAGSLLERRYEPLPVALPVPSAETPAASAAVPTPARSQAPDSSRVPPTAAVPEPSWEALAGGGKYREALASAEKVGFDQLVGELGEDNLLLLANCARYGGNTARAHQALLALRARFSGHRGAALAAFYLAREALDANHEPAAAVKWFETFLVESPQGDLAALARANLMSILLTMGERAKARKVAADYLHYHPNGEQAKQARALLEQPTSTR